MLACSGYGASKVTLPSASRMVAFLNLPDVVRTSVFCNDSLLCKMMDGNKLGTEFTNNLSIHFA